MKERRAVAYTYLYMAGMSRKCEEIPMILGLKGVGIVRLDYDVKKMTLTSGSQRQ
jgi:hypothetical protein